MNNKPYKRKPGDFEIRILNDGKVIMIAPDESLIEVAQAVDPVNTPAKNGDKGKWQKPNK
jgi:hypothetical protein